MSREKQGDISPSPAEAAAAADATQEANALALEARRRAEAFCRKAQQTMEFGEKASVPLLGMQYQVYQGLSADQARAVIANRSLFQDDPFLKVLYNQFNLIAAMARKAWPSGEREARKSAKEVATLSSAIVTNCENPGWLLIFSGAFQAAIFLLQSPNTAELCEAACEVNTEVSELIYGGGEGSSGSGDAGTERAAKVAGASQGETTSDPPAPLQEQILLARHLLGSSLHFVGKNERAASSIKESLDFIDEARTASAGTAVVAKRGKEGGEETASRISPLNSITFAMLHSASLLYGTLASGMAGDTRATIEMWRRLRLWRDEENSSAGRGGAALHPGAHLFEMYSPLLYDTAAIVVLHCAAQTMPSSFASSSEAAGEAVDTMLKELASSSPAAAEAARMTAMALGKQAAMQGDGANADGGAKEECSPLDSLVSCTHRVEAYDVAASFGTLAEMLCKSGYVSVAGSVLSCAERLMDATAGKAGADWRKSKRHRGVAILFQELGEAFSTGYADELD